MSTTIQPEAGEVYLKISTAMNPFEKDYAKVLDVKAGYIQFKTGKAADYTPSSPKSMTVKKFMDTYGPQ